MTTEKPSKQARIQKLSENVINRIAAGEVIQRPSNALKELLENSLDAKSTQIKLCLRDGGITELRIEDNGDGILSADFPLLCERFATSKLSKFEDLYSIATYGFRGEALASISFCAQLSVTSKTKNESCAYRGHFLNGHMYDPDDPDIDYKQIKPQIVAGNAGTQIIVKKLFYNMPLREKALKSRYGQEYNLCLRVVSCYAIHNYHCSFSVKKLIDGSNSNLFDLNYRSTPNKTSKDVIKSIYGGDIAPYLIEIGKEHSKIKGLKIKGVISNCDFAMNVSGNVSNKNRNKSKKRIFNTNNRMEFVLFINHRLVESSMIKKCIQSVYNDYLSKNHHPFVYLSIEIPPSFVDVNVHPTKKEVRFLHKEQVLELIQDSINEKLKIENNSRTFHAHSLQHFMTQSNINNVVCITSPKKIKKTKHDLKKKNNVNKDEKEKKEKNLKCDNDDIVVVKKEDIKNKRNELISSLSQSIKTTNGQKRGILNLDDDSDEITQDEQVDDDEDDKDDKDDKYDSISPHAPLKRRKIKKPHISNVVYTDIVNTDNTDNNIHDIMDIDQDDSDAVNSNNHFNSNHNHNNNGNNLNNFNFRHRNVENNRNNRIPFKRKRSYSDMISTEDDEEEEHDDSLNLNLIQPSIISLNLNEKKRYKAKKSTRVRTDSQQSSLDYYWKGTRNTNKRTKISDKHEQKKQESDIDDNDDDNDDGLNPLNPLKRNEISYFTKKQVQKKVINPPQCVVELIETINKNCDKNLKKMFEENVFVGCVDCIDNTLKNKNKLNEFIENTYQRVLFQYDTKLFLCNIHRISRVYFFELCIKNIGKFRSIYKLIPNPSLKKEGKTKCLLPTIYDLIMLALDVAESGYDEKVVGSKKEVALSVTDTLCQESIAKILFNYFSIEIDIKNKTIKSIPCLIDGYIPPLLYLPIFLFRLITEIEWFKHEDIDEPDINDQNLFKQISMEIARFYQIRPPQFYFELNAETNNNKSNNNKRFGGYLDKTERNMNNKHNLGWILHHVIFRSMNKKCTKYSFHPPQFLCNDGSMVQIACTKQLYKVFERC